MSVVNGLEINKQMYKLSIHVRDSLVVPIPFSLQIKRNQLQLKILTRFIYQTLYYIHPVDSTLLRIWDVNMHYASEIIDTFKNRSKFINFRAWWTNILGRENGTC